MKYLFYPLWAFVVAASPAPCHTRSEKPPAFILAGDSTTAVQAANGGGWGNGFLSFLRDGAWGVNKGHNGATTVSFVKGGDWATVKGYVDSKKAEGYEVYVTIQFGHNDQKPAANISLEQYKTNLENLALDIKSRGGTPLLVTPLTRRSFTSEHNASDSLHNERLYTIAAADATATTYLDLNKYSLEYVNAIGNTSAQNYDLNGYGADMTHLNSYGSVVFGRLVADLLLQKEKGLEKYFTPNETLSYDLQHGIAA
ncbi:uncharacterized protein JN550_008366 [Neoarthrinium moseri]|uniref:uncharacterized protein n=1 Tax=Neoarthrinium moseri TaxID=1658444 RepID=UPI001FDB9434|nr:uncharacterized protein JN550_008366 [Neoarthrinium moseri]KAI1865318.1 hypothetical protein JN550_008366 [Neoarthrinium moseri]